jgi:hypothetical protein
MTTTGEAEKTRVTAAPAAAAAPVPGPEADALYRRRALIGFGIFGLFFIFYLGTAIIQTPACEAIATTPCLGMPLGLLLSLGIFPVSWALIALFFWKMR